MTEVAMTAELKLTNLTMEWPNGHRGLDGIDLIVPRGSSSLSSV